MQRPILICDLTPLMFGIVQSTASVTQKGVFISETDHLLGFGKYKAIKTIEDVEMAEILTFFTNLYQGDRTAHLMMNVPDQFLVHTSPEYDEMVAKYDAFLSKRLATNLLNLANTLVKNWKDNPDPGLAYEAVLNYRLCKELLQTEQLYVVRTDIAELSRIESGEISGKQVQKIFDTELDEIRMSLNKTTLQSMPDVKAMDALMRKFRSI